MQKYFPIVIFCYNRFSHLKRTFSFLKKNLNSKKYEIIIFSDGPKNKKDKIKILNIRNYLKTINHFKKKKIIERKKNFGLHDNIVNGVSNVLKKYTAAIFLEDDLQTNKYFLSNMDYLIRKFKNEKKIGCISGYSYPIKIKKEYPDIYLIKGGECWGWATWSDRWKYFNKSANKIYNHLKNTNQLKEFNFEKGNLKNLIKTKKNNKFSWAIKWHGSLFINKKFTIFPKFPSVNNFGFDASGENCNYGYNIYYNKNIKKKFIINLKNRRTEILENLEIKKELLNFFRNKNVFHFEKVVGYTKRLINNYF
jgi:hypothetical protein